MLREEIGDSAFFRAARAYQARYRHGTAVTDDFRAAAEGNLAYLDNALKVLESYAIRYDNLVHVIPDTPEAHVRAGRCGGARPGPHHHPEHRGKRPGRGSAPVRGERPGRPCRGVAHEERRVAEPAQARIQEYNIRGVPASRVEALSGSPRP